MPPQPHSTGQSDGGSFSVEVPSSPVTLDCVKLTVKPQQHTSLCEHVPVSKCPGDAQDRLSFTRLFSGMFLSPFTEVLKDGVRCPCSQQKANLLEVTRLLTVIAVVKGRVH